MAHFVVKTRRFESVTLKTPEGVRVFNLASAEGTGNLLDYLCHCVLTCRMTFEACLEYLTWLGLPGDALERP